MPQVVVDVWCRRGGKMEVRSQPVDEVGNGVRQWDGGGTVGDGAHGMEMEVLQVGNGDGIHVPGWSQRWMADGAGAVDSGAALGADGELPPVVGEWSAVWRCMEDGDAGR